MADFTKEIIGQIQSERKKYEDASQVIRTDIKKARQYYANKFESPKDVSGAEKVFVPLTQWEVDTLASKTFVNDKAITVLPENEKSVPSALIGEQVLKKQIKETRFPTHFRNSLFDLSRDGTTVWGVFWNFQREVFKEKGLMNKVKKFFGKGPKPKVNVLKDMIGFQQIDILNVYIDPTADSIQDAPSIGVKTVMSVADAKANRLWKNTKDITGFTTSKFDTYDATSVRPDEIGKSTIDYEYPMTEVYQRWGKIPLSWLTRKKKDKEIMIDGVVEIADIEDKPTLLRVDKNPFDHGMKPFEETWFQKTKGKWYGVGPGLKLMNMQKYLNKTVNRAIKNEDTLHSGLWKIKRGSGLSARSIVSSPGGVVEVDNMTDLEQLQVRDVAQLATPAIQRIFEFVEKINGANQIATGSAADRSATTSIIKDRNADTRFAVVRGNINDFLVRFFKQWLSVDRQFITKKFILRVTGDEMLMKKIDEIKEIPEELRDESPFRFIDVSPETLRGDFDLEVDIDNSQPLNKAENAQRILTGIQTGVQLGLKRDYDKMFDAYLDHIGLTGLRFKTEQDLPVNVDQQLQAQEAEQNALQGLQQEEPLTELQQFNQANQ